MRGTSITLTVLTLALAATPLGAQSLRGSQASLERQSREARAHNYSYLQESADVQRFVRSGLLVELEGNADYELARVSYPYARPEVKSFIERFAREYRKVCGEKLVVTSLVRPVSEQPQNASERSVHPTGIAFDIRRNNEPECRGWVESTLLMLEKEGVLEATHERRPPHYHVALFPRHYKRYLAAGGGLNSTGSAYYLVRQGDSLWTIAKKHNTTVDELKRVNGLRSSRVVAGQVLRIPESGR